MRALALAILVACGGSSQTAPVAADPVGIGVAECAVCGMVVREQPTPRGQVMHRDGEHLHVCSVGDLRAYLQNPGPKGKPIGAWVEVVGADFDPAASDVAELPWVAVDDATWVVGFERPFVMGRPAAALRTPEDAQALATRLGGRTATWTQLVHTPFSRDPR